MIEHADCAVCIPLSSFLTFEVVPLRKSDSICVSALKDSVAFYLNNKSKPRSSRDLWKRAVLRQAGFRKDYDSDDEEDTQTVEKILASRSTRTRPVFCQWPRDLKGKLIETPPGKCTPNGLPWGATLFDFYMVNRAPDIPGFMTITTGSKLAAWTKANNETEIAADEIEWAEREEEPKEIPPCDVVELIRTNEDRVHNGVARLLGAESLEIKEEDRQCDETLPRSLYHPSSYPKPWPFVPFSYDVPSLESFIPFRSLPKKLIVHDPWHLLRAQGAGFPTQEDTWTSQNDATYVYNLELSARGLERIEKETEEAQKAKENAPEITPGQAVNHDIQNQMEGFMIRPGPDVPDGPVEPPIFVITPPTPAPSTVDEAHLYLSINHKAGVGNHSYVYYAEWELPRSLFAPGTLCRKCIDEDVDRILKEQDGEDGSKKEEFWKTKSGELKHVRVTDPGIVFHECFSKTTGSSEDQSASTHAYTMKEATDETLRIYEGPVRPIKTTVRHRNLKNAPYCHHYAEFTSSNHPLTAKFRVVAKLSMRYDTHLNSEAKNYQAFPEHLSQHWSGFNIVYPIHDPVPVSAVVPQFYGYYVPDMSTTVEEKYLSPILLVEDCGKPIEPQELDIDDTNECASLFYRFHDSGWLHGSIYPRNILQKPGPISMFPAFRGLVQRDDVLHLNGGKRSFRVIDFGRSTTYKDGREAISERGDVERILKHTGNARGDELIG